MHAHPLDATFAALADPTRRAILARLAEGDAPVGAVAAPFDITLPSVSRHLEVLEAAGLITRDRDAQRRIRRLRAGRLEEASAWIERYRAFWEGRLDALADYVDQLDGGGGGRGGE